MKIAIIGPGINPIPPNGWGAVEILIWDTKNFLEKIGHEVSIINTRDRRLILESISKFNPDFVHIHYDEYIDISGLIKCPFAATSHFGYLERSERYAGYSRIFNGFVESGSNIFCLSSGISDVYERAGVKKDRLFLVPNGVDSKAFDFCENPSYPDRSLYLAKIDFRKRQRNFQSIPSIWYAGNIADRYFDTGKNYLGEWDKKTLHSELTHYGNLVLLSDGEAHPLVCMEALCSGLGLVISQYSAANLDINKDFISIIPENRIGDLDFVEKTIIKNREFSVSNRKAIKEYSLQFDWQKIIDKFYIPSVLKVIAKCQTS